MNFIEWFMTIVRGRKTKLLSDNNRQETNQNNSLGEQRKSFFNRLHKPVSNDASKYRKIHNFKIFSNRCYCEGAISSL